MPEVPRVIIRPDEVTYDLTAQEHVTITVPSGSQWTSGLHWHETHTEYLKLIKGKIKVRLGHEFMEIEASGDHQPEVKVPRYEWHEWQRATPDGDDVVVQEHTDPADGEKALFFWNLNGVIQNSGKISEGSIISRSPGGLQDVMARAWVTLNLFTIFYELDNFPVFVNFGRVLGGVGGLQALDWLVSKAVLLVAAWVGWLVNARAVRAKYTPSAEYALYMERKKGNKGE